MKKYKYVTGIIIIFLLFLLMGSHITGISNHKLLGMSFFGLIGIQVLLNSSWFIGIVDRLKKSGNSLINLLWLILNTFLTIDLLLLFVSSIVIVVIESNPWKFVHTASAYAGIMLIGIYIGFHWNMVMGSTRRALKLKYNKARNVVLRIIVASMVFFGISASCNREVGEKFTYYFEEQQQEVKEDYIGNLYLDYINIISIYIAIGHYGIKTINYINRRILKGVKENEPVKDKE